VARARVLISDLDGTLVGDEAALDRFAAWRRHQGRHWRLVYATGRTVESVVELVETSALPMPDAVIAGVGNAIVEGQALAPWSDWPGPLRRWAAPVVRAVLASEAGMVLQPESAQSDIKVSYYAGVLGHRDLVRARRRLRAAGVDARLVYSAGRFLDVLPRSVGKRAAARYLLGRWGIDHREAVTAGDTGNDRDLLHLGGHGIVVGNASAELRTMRGPRIIHVGRTHADGVLEGLRLIEEATRTGGRAPDPLAVAPASGTMQRPR
jgi:sucrose-6F-phosphate phosphohydrolase